jgi:hypothetical protein
MIALLHTPSAAFTALSPPGVSSQIRSLLYRSTELQRHSFLNEGLSRSQSAFAEGLRGPDSRSSSKTHGISIFYCVTCALSTPRRPASDFPAKVMLLRSEDVSLFASFSRSSISFCSFPPSSLANSNTSKDSHPVEPAGLLGLRPMKLRLHPVFRGSLRTWWGIQQIYMGAVKEGIQGYFGHVVLMLDTQNAMLVVSSETGVASQRSRNGV